MDPAAGCLHGGRKQEFLAHESHFSTSILSLLSLFLSLVVRSFVFLLALALRASTERKRNMRGLPGAEPSRNGALKLPPALRSLVSTRRGTMRIQNTDP